ncbi:MAG: 23S rRNA (uridine(2552)-2'-O)-methyltransferase RlmE [Candidatus Endonucleobacter bathymodioli]|uniref:Ribosomal RNA large subunit methyltransferase E n=1 Tax=Candidatus Endonucleibacter bathymodioli TaxID=539814 RepID=A0AA90NZH0_9GAMM|nr:23S rRNA (uridine(2552)-2'-O)-methyltransferase RlmE [Candidatus Endonucleobacter bathymodioli]
MARSKDSGRWLKEHFNDHYVKLSKKEGWRSRASYKLLEIQEKHCVIQPGMRVLDLGAAPGGWSQVAISLVGNGGQVVASDILPMDPISRVDFILGDFTQEDVLESIIETIGIDLVDLVMSDMAPNISGIMAVDQSRSMCLVELVLDIAQHVLRKNGSFLVKVFHGDGFEAYFKDMRTSFGMVKTCKPKASRSGSREVYLLGKSFKG